MRVLSSSILATLTEEEFPLEDDVDRLFGKLRKIEPPSDIAKQIIARIKRLPAPPPLPQPDPSPADKQHEAAE